MEAPASLGVPMYAMLLTAGCLSASRLTAYSLLERCRFAVVFDAEPGLPVGAGRSGYG